MYCPECGAEYREGFDQCSDCGVALVAERPAGDGGEPGDWVVVYETSELDILPVLKSLLQSAEIPYETKGEDLMNLFPSEALTPITTRHRGEVQIVVPPDRAGEARELLATEFEGNASGEDSDD